MSDTAASQRPARRVLVDVVTGQRRTVLMATILLMAWQACESAVPVLIGVVIDRAILPGSVSALVAWLAVLAVLFVVLSLSFRFGARFSRAAAERSAAALRVRLTAARLHAPASDDRSVGEVVSIVSSDVERVGAFCALVPRTCGALVSVVVAAVLVLRLNIVVGLVVVIGAALMVPLLHLAGGPLERRSGHEQARAGDLSTLATDLVGGLRILAGLGATANAAQRYRRASRDALTATVRAARAEGAYTAVTLGLTLLFLAAVTLLAGRAALDGDLGIGGLVATVGVAQFLLGPFAGLSMAGAALARARASAARVAGVLEHAHPAAIATVDPVANPLAEHDAEHDAASGPGRRTPGELRLDALGLVVPAGAMVGLVADNVESSGLATTLAAAAAGHVLTVDGLDPGAVPIAAVPDLVLVAPHEARLFSGSVVDNLDPDSDPGRRGTVEGAVEAADVDEVLGRLPRGAESEVGERGRSLSGGQRQRVALARALVADPAVLVLHDPTTAVDSVTEQRIATGIRRYRQGRTTVLIATSPALLAVCDEVVRVEDGRIADRGSHQALLDSDPDYAGLVLA